MTRYNECPACGSYDLRDMWRRGRKLRQECCECEWFGKERTPEQKEISNTRRMPAGHIGGHTFEVFDKYGHILMSSRSYPTAEEAKAALRRELAVGSVAVAGPYTGVLWPSTVVVEGTIIK